MVAEVVKALRVLSRPLRRQFWWPTPNQERTERPGVVLVSFDELEGWEHRRLRKELSHYTEQPLSDGALPRDNHCDHHEPESGWATLHRAVFVLLHTVLSSPRLRSGRTSWAQHLCEADDLARLQYHVMMGRCYIHIGTLHTRRIKVLIRLRRFLAGLEDRPYELWVVVRKQRIAYLPSSLHLPDAPLKVREVVEMARRRPRFEPARKKARKVPKPPGVIRIMSYNLHSCIGLDGRVSIRRIAEVLHLYDPDFVALQEIDVGRRRTDRRHQLQELSRLWPAEGEFLPLMKVRGGEYGIGFLSRLPVLECRSGILPSATQMLPQEARGFQMVAVRLPGGRRLEIINTHLGLTPRERVAQLKGLEKLCAMGDDPQVLTGDFNCRPTSREYRLITRGWRPTQSKPRKTWFGTFPLRHLDYCFVRGEVEVKGTYVPRDSLTRLASDHLPLITDLEIPERPTR